MINSTTIGEINRELARRINQEARSNPQSPYADRFPDPSKTFGLEASRDYDEVHEIWSVR